MLRVGSIIFSLSDDVPLLLAFESNSSNPLLSDNFSPVLLTNTLKPRCYKFFMSRDILSTITNWPVNYNYMGHSEFLHIPALWVFTQTVSSSLYLPDISSGSGRYTVSMHFNWTWYKSTMLADISSFGVTLYQQTTSMTVHCFQVLILFMVWWHPPTISCPAGTDMHRCQIWVPHSSRNCLNHITKYCHYCCVHR